jgi:pyruvate kinase
MMAETCLLAEAAICYPPLFDDIRAIQPRPTETVETVAIAAVAAASEQNASAILVLSTSGNTARLISKYRPAIPIITGTYFNLGSVTLLRFFFSYPQRANC